jgi:hypothetical protein
MGNRGKHEPKDQLILVIYHRQSARLNVSLLKARAQLKAFTLLPRQRTSVQPPSNSLPSSSVRSDEYSLLTERIDWVLPRPPYVLTLLLFEPRAYYSHETSVLAPYLFTNNTKIYSLVTTFIEVRSKHYFASHSPTVHPRWYQVVLDELTVRLQFRLHTSWLRRKLASESTWSGAGKDLHWRQIRSGEAAQSWWLIL